MISPTSVVPQQGSMARTVKGYPPLSLLVTCRYNLPRFVSAYSNGRDGAQLPRWRRGTRSRRVLEEMKKAMWKVDRTGGFRFSDGENPEQASILEDHKDDPLSLELQAALRGETVTVADVKRYVLTETPACLFKSAFKTLECQKLLEVVNPKPDRRKGTFSDEEMLVRLVPSSSRTPVPSGASS